MHHHHHNPQRLTRLAIIAALALLGAVVCAPSPARAATTDNEIHQRVLGGAIGYLQENERPDSLALLPPPPQPDSLAFSVDQEKATAAVAQYNTPRWHQAAQDAHLKFPEAAQAFSCALGAPITEKNTPHLYTLLRRSMVDAGMSTNAAKKYYQRQRPFVTNHTPLCTPAERDDLAANGSYPSGHSAIGWAWALILAEIAPDRAQPVLARGLSYTQSRLACNVHWQSDIDQARIMGAATVARLHANPVFRRDLAKAKTELAAVRARKDQPSVNCPAEAAALR